MTTDNWSIQPKLCLHLHLKCLDSGKQPARMSIREGRKSRRDNGPFTDARFFDLFSFKQKISLTTQLIGARAKNRRRRGHHTLLRSFFALAPIFARLDFARSPSATERLLRRIA